MAQSAAEIINAILTREGSEYTNDPIDAGGPTKWGITQATLSRYLGHPATEAEVQNLTRDMAVEIYQALYVNCFLNSLGAISPRLLGLLVDSGVQHGTQKAIKWLQTAVGADPVDGSLGPQTAIRWLPYANGTRDQEEVYRTVLCLRIKFYAAIIHDNPSQSKYANGWFARVCEFI